MTEETQDKKLNMPEILETVKYFWAEVWLRKGWIMLSAILFGILFVVLAWLTPRYYPAPLTFTVNTDEGGGGVSGMMAVLGELGMGGGQTASNYEKIGALAKSRKIVEQTLKTKVRYDGKLEYLGNIVLDSYQIKFDDDALAKIRFSDTITIVNNAAYEKVLKKTYLVVVGDEEDQGLLAYDYDDETTVITLKALANSPRLSIILAQAHYQNLSNYYIANNISKQRETYNLVAAKSDSIYGELRAAESGLARVSDMNQGLVLNQSRLSSLQLGRKVEILYIMYGEALKNKETAQFMLNNATPYFGVIDTPIEPIQVQGASRAMGLLKGGIIGLLLGMGLVIGRRYLLDEIGV